MRSEQEVLDRLEEATDPTEQKILAWMLEDGDDYGTSDSGWRSNREGQERFR